MPSDDDYEMDDFVVSDSDSVEYYEDNEEEYESFEELQSPCVLPDHAREWCNYQLQNHNHDDKMQSKIEFVNSYPWNKTRSMPIAVDSAKEDRDDFWKEIQNNIDNNISFMPEVCEELLNTISRIIVNPMSKSKPILLTSVPGCGKSRILNKVFGPALGVPVEYINVGGFTKEDLAGLKGSSGVWQGSGPSIILQAIHKAQFNNIIIVFDEFDKIIDEQVYHFFNQLFDDTTTVFRDQFLNGLSFDISQIIFVCIANTTNSITDSVLNRFKKHIHINPPNNEMKITICTKHTIPEILSKFMFAESDVIFTKETLKLIIQKHRIKNTEGMRRFNHIIESIVENINTQRLRSNISFPLKITNSMV